MTKNTKPYHHVTITTNQHYHHLTTNNYHSTVTTKPYHTRTKRNIHYYAITKTKLNAAP